MSRNVLLWIDLPSDPESAPAKLAKCIKAIARKAEFPMNGLGLRPITLDGNMGPEAFFEIGRGRDRIDEKTLTEEIQRILRSERLMKLSAGLRIRDTSASHGDWPDSFRAYFGDQWGDLGEWRKDPSSPAGFPTVPPNLWGQVFPLELTTTQPEMGGYEGYRSPELKALWEGLISDLVFEVQPTRLVSSSRPFWGDWRDEASANVTYYLRPIDMGLSLKLLFGFECSPQELANVLTSQEFLRKLPDWRKCPLEDGEIPREGLFLRWRWQSSSTDDPRDTPDDSPPLLEALKETLRERSLDDFTEIRWGQTPHIDPSGAPALYQADVPSLRFREKR